MAGATLKGPGAGKASSSLPVILGAPAQGSVGLLRLSEVQELPCSLAYIWIWGVRRLPHPGRCVHVEVSCYPGTQGRSVEAVCEGLLRWKHWWGPLVCLQGCLQLGPTEPRSLLGDGCRVLLPELPHASGNHPHQDFPSPRSWAPSDSEDGPQG